jgi:hypothetical protein
MDSEVELNDIIQEMRKYKNLIVLIHILILKFFIIFKM